MIRSSPLTSGDIHGNFRDLVPILQNVIFFAADDGLK
jgi:hypothetical protein